LRSRWRVRLARRHVMSNRLVLPFVLGLIAAVRVFFQSRTDMAVEVLAPASGRAEAETAQAAVAPSGSAILGLCLFWACV